MPKTHDSLHRQKVMFHLLMMVGLSLPRHRTLLGCERYGTG